MRDGQASIEPASTDSVAPTVAQDTPLVVPAEPAAASAPAGEGCPPPLAWQDVLRDFHEQAESWYLDRPGGYRLTGRMFGRGPALYLMNGMGGSLDLMVLLVWLLREDFRCVIYDYPGTHPANGWARRPQLDDYVADLLAVADTCGDRQFHLFGTSFGSLVSLGALLNHPDRIMRAVLQGGFACRKLSLAEKALIRMCAWYPGRLRHVPFRTLVAAQVHRLWFPPFDESRWAFFLDNVGRTPVRALTQRGAIINATDLRPRLGEIRQPVLLLHAEGDGLVNEECCQTLEQGLSDARREMLLNSGHLPFLTHPHRVAKLVRNFLLAETLPDSSPPAP